MPKESVWDWAKYWNMIAAMAVSKPNNYNQSSSSSSHVGCAPWLHMSAALNAAFLLMVSLRPNSLLIPSTPLGESIREHWWKLQGISSEGQCWPRPLVLSSLGNEFKNKEKEPWQEIKQWWSKCVSITEPLWDKMVVIEQKHRGSSPNSVVMHPVGHDLITATSAPLRQALWDILLRH